MPAKNQYCYNSETVLERSKKVLWYSRQCKLTFFEAFALNLRPNFLSNFVHSYVLSKPYIK